MSFRIAIIKTQINPKELVFADNDGVYRRGKGIIVLGDLREYFYPSMEYWKKEDYERHWCREIERIVSGKVVKTALIDEMPAPYRRSSGISWWPMYCEDGKVYFHFQICSLDKWPKPMYVSRLLKSVSDRKRRKVSEWVVSIEDLKRFLRK